VAGLDFLTWAELGAVTSFDPFFGLIVLFQSKAIKEDRWKTLVATVDDQPGTLVLQIVPRVRQHYAVTAR
jgi:hypothetical protein